MLLTTTKTLCKTHLKKDDKIHFALLGTTLTLGIFYILFNQLTLQYPGHLYIPNVWLALTPIIILLFLFSLYALPIKPHLAYFTKTYCFYFLTYIALGTLTTGIQYTPFNTTDIHLLHMDQALHFDQIQWLHFGQRNQFTHTLLQIIYNSLFTQLITIPLLMIWLKEKKLMNRFFSSLLIAYILGTLVYYFFPAVGPAAILNDPHFTSQQKKCRHTILSTPPPPKLNRASLRIYCTSFFPYYLGNPNYLYYKK